MVTAGMMAKSSGDPATTQHEDCAAAILESNEQQGHRQAALVLGLAVRLTIRNRNHGDVLVIEEYPKLEQHDIKDVWWNP